MEGFRFRCDVKREVRRKEMTGNERMLKGKLKAGSAFCLSLTNKVIKGGQQFDPPSPREEKARTPSTDAFSE